MTRVTKFLKPISLNVFMSNKYIYAQVKHTPTSFTLAHASSAEKALAESLQSTSDKVAAGRVGQALAERLQEKNITAVAFEMKPTERYHGKLRAMLDSLRASGIKLL